MTMPDPHDPRDRGADRHHRVGVDHHDRHHGHVRLERHARDAGAAAVQPAVGAAGALGVDAQQIAAAQHLQSRVEGCLGRLAAGAIDRQLAGRPS